jgi:lambda family phage portal protein
MLKNILKKITGPNKKELKRMIGVYKRQYEAAKVNRLTSSWGTVNTSINHDLKTALKPLRARSRNLVQNNDYARRFIKLCAANIVGPTGIQFQSRVQEFDGRPDEMANRDIERSWHEWCDIIGWLEIQHLAIEAVGQDGEVLIQIHYNAPNKYGIALQILEADYLDSDYNDPALNIKMGVELDSIGKPVAYHIFTRHPGDDLYTAGNVRERIRVPADKMIHLFYAERPGQIRGVPWMASAMTRLNNIGGYEEAEIIAARIGAAHMGFLTRPENGEDMVGEKDADDNILIEAEPGSFPVLPPGYTVDKFNPTHPGGNFDPFIKATIRGIASGLDVSYSALSGDLTQASYGSQRQGALYERDHWMVKQSWFINKLCRPVFDKWILLYLASDRLTKLPIEKSDKFNKPLFQARRWHWIDPLKDSQANVLQIENRLKSRSEVVAEQGRDFYELVDQIAMEEQYIKSKGLSVEKVDKAVGVSNEKDGAEEDDDQGK